MTPRDDSTSPSNDGPTLSERLRGRFGDEVDPEIRIARRDEDRSAASRDVLERLVGRHDHFGRYRIHGEVAHGGMGAILHVWDDDLRRDLAMKVVLDRRGGRGEPDKRRVARFLEEAQVTGQLDHPGIVPVHELGLDSGGQVYFTMKLVKGRALDRVFELARSGEDGWSVTRAVGVLLKMCEAVSYAHSKGVIHRDLKPANVMVGRFGEVYVMDWGLAKVLGSADAKDIRVREARPEPDTPTAVDDGGGDTAPSAVRTDRAVADDEAELCTMDGDILGTPAYMSPEQARGEIDALGPATDVYAVGAMLYHLLAGTRPHGESAGHWEILRRLRAGPPTPITAAARDAPAELVAICERAMAREPTDRYPHMSDLADDLQAYLEGRVVRAHRTGAVAELRKWTKRNRGLAAALSLVALLLVAGLVTTVSLYTRSEESAADARAAADRAEASARLAEERRALAESHAERARLSEELAHRRTEDVLRLSAQKDLAELEQRANTLWPMEPRTIPAYESWLAEARDIVATLDEHRRTLEELDARLVAERAAAEEADALALRGDVWWRDQLAALVDKMEGFDRPGDGLIALVQQRVEVARALPLLTLERYRSEWDDAVDAIAAHDDYGGLRIAPQLGLVPLGPDPRSGLWEFAHVVSGSPPQRDPASGELQLRPENGVVLVLLPGGTFTMGAQSEDPSAPQYDPHAVIDESPVHEITLAPFFFSKYELTQHQWLRFTDTNPSRYVMYQPYGEAPVTPLHPVEQVDWDWAAATMHEMGLVLPTEAQWEYAARGGTSTTWWTGDDRETLRGAANLADQSARQRIGARWSDIDDWPELDDGRALHAPVDGYRANPFGIHNVAGNVWEWCRDGYEGYFQPPRAGDGARESLTPNVFARTMRGGSYLDAANDLRSAARSHAQETLFGSHVGVRPARPLRD